VPQKSSGPALTAVEWTGAKPESVVGYTLSRKQSPDDVDSSCHSTQAVYLRERQERFRQRELSKWGVGHSATRRTPPADTTSTRAWSASSTELVVIHVW